MDRNELIGEVRKLVAAPCCCAEAKAAGERYIAAAGTEGEKAAADALLRELEEDVCTIDDLVAFTGSETGAKILGADGAKAMNADARKAKADGAKYCFCPACAAGAAILESREALA